MADKYELLVDWGPYDKAVLDAMYDIRCCGMPVSFLLLDRRKTITYCHMCASLISLAIPYSKVIQGNLEVLDGDEHLWGELATAKSSLQAVYDEIKEFKTNNSVRYKRKDDV